MGSSFDYFADEFPALATFGSQAERYCNDDSNSALIKIGMIGETIVNAIYGYTGTEVPSDGKAVSKIRKLDKEGYLPQPVVNLLHEMRKARNKAVHENLENPSLAAQLIRASYGVCLWFAMSYGSKHYVSREYASPAKPSAATTRKVPRTTDDEDEKLVQETHEAAKRAPKVSKAERLKRVMAAENQRPKSEDETRLLIDSALRDAGWEADTHSLRYSKGIRPRKGHNMAIAEWPTDSEVSKFGRMDYALFVGETLVATVEAKAEHKSIFSVLDVQCIEYSSHIREQDMCYVPVTYGKYQVPFTFATNGRPYLKQFETESGIWFRDLRDPSRPSKALHGWPRPEALLDEIKRDRAAADRWLGMEPYDVLRDKNGLNLRDYQVNAVEAAERAVEEGKRTALIAMATGTGKTRTAIAMIYRFLKSGRFRRILYLVDRNALGTQTENALKNVKIEQLMALDQIYDVQGLDSSEIGPETRISIATVQSMIRRIVYYDGEGDKPAVSDFDLIVVDEAHRGYILDKEMSDEESLYRNQRDFQSKYREVIDYFDAVKIALTATPALHTTQIFGAPVYSYTYREAVIDGWLVDHDVPHVIKTKLTEEGIHLRKGDKVAIYDPASHELLNGAELEDELDFDVDDFNKRIIDENVDRTILTEVARDIDPEEPGKTLIFAVNDTHADMIVRILKDIYADTGVDSEAIMKITDAAGGGNPKRVEGLIRRFQNEQYPSIVVTVDLLTTGIDVPEITTLVFMRRVRSRILFEQMLGRATRLCPAIHKTHFEIYDPVGVYASLDPVTAMSPVSANPSTTIAQIIDGLDEYTDDDRLQAQIDSLVAKAQRKIHAMTDKQRQDLERLAGYSLEEFVRGLHDDSPQDARRKAKEQGDVLAALDGVHAHHGHGIVISDKEDELLSHDRDYGGGTRPEDYLEAFASYVRTHVNEVAALNLCVTKPNDLTTKSLRELELALDREGYNETSLNRAESDVRNAEVAADIISYVRRAALGSPLVSHEDRIHDAVDRLKRAHDFSKQELNWLDRIEKYLINDSVLNASVFDSDERFRSKGGSKRIDKVFHGQLYDIVRELNGYLYDDKGHVA